MIEHLHRVAAHAYHCGEIDVGRRCCERLLRLPLSAEKEEKVRGNRTWYTQTLSDQGVAAEFKQIDVPPARVGWSLFNPSVVSHGGRLLVNVRSSNYSIAEAGNYVIPPEDRETIRTLNCLVDGGESHYWAADYDATGFPVEGLEDVRLNSMDGELILSVGGRLHHLRSGDSLTWDAAEPHWSRNPTDRTTWALKAATPPNF